MRLIKVSSPETMRSSIPRLVVLAVAAAAAAVADAAATLTVHQPRGTDALFAANRQAMRERHLQLQGGGDSNATGVVGGLEGCIPSEQKCPAGGEGSSPQPICTPFRSPEHCGNDLSFPTLIRARTDHVKNNRALLEADGWWFHHLDDKLASYVYSASGGHNPPKMYFCSSDGAAGLDEFAGSVLPPAAAASGGGFVVRATHLHSNKGVYVLPNGFGGVELIRGMNMSLADVKTDLARENVTNVVVEQFVPGPRGTLPTEYKFHMFGGRVGSITVVHGRGSPCGGCWAEIDENGERLDQFGCFAPAGYKRKSPYTRESGEACYAIDFAAGSQNPSPIKGVDMCSSIPDIEPCIFQDMANIAKKISLDVGVYVRVDMFVSAEGNVHVQEFSTNHLNGQRHCSARLSGDCIDSCFLGRMWNETGSLPGANTTFGGSKVGAPGALGSFVQAQGEADKCRRAVAFVPAAPAETTCPTSRGGRTNMTNGVQDGGCAVCGDGHVVTCPGAIVRDPRMPDYPCGMLQDAGYQGLLPDDVCMSLHGVVQDVCGCALMPEAAGASCPAPAEPQPEPAIAQGGCSICGDGRRVGCKNAMFSDPRMPDYSCGMLEAAGWKGMIELDVCLALNPMVAETCGCHAVGSAAPSCSS